MSLNPGTRLGSYEVLAKLGEGGMGEVYRAADTNLKRSVAIKVLPASVAGDADRLARFQREAEILAALNHPNIAAIYGLERSPDGTALVMELVDGTDLSGLIANHAGLPLAEVLPIAGQIADALEAAHEQGIVHRDLKPQNVKVRADGTVKVLDFGLAKVADATEGSGGTGVLNSPTMTARATQMGMIIGTAAYMSPEQAKGKPVDKRADIWAFGVVLYEMLTGRRMFDGDDVSTTLAQVLMRDPEWAALPADTPPGLVTLMRRCLERDPKLRLRDIGEARLLLSDPRTMSGTLLTVAPGASTPKSRISLPFAGAALVLAGFAAAAAWWLKPAPPVALHVTRFQYALPDGQMFTRTGRHVTAISPDGSKIAFVANAQLYLREIGQLDAAPIRGTAEDPAEPVFSPDGQSIAYFAVATTGTTGVASVLKRIPVAGGTPQTLYKLSSLPAGASWKNGLIAFGQSGGIDVITDSGGTPRTVVKPDAGIRAVQPQLIDEGRRVLYTAIAATAATDEGQVVVQALDGTSRAEVIKAGVNAQLLPTGHLLYVQKGTLFAVPFDERRNAVIGTALPVVEGVAEVSGTWSGQFSVSSNGTLVYRPGGYAGRSRSMSLVDRQGIEKPSGMPYRDHAMPRLSPDGRRLVVSAGDDEIDIWVWDLAKGTHSRLTFGPAAEAFAVWMPDSQRIVFRSTDAGRTDIFRRNADGTGGVEALTKNGTGGDPEAVSPDGKYLIYRTGDPVAGDANLHVLPLDGTGQSRPLLADPNYDEFGAEVSPDGRWIAYQSNESTRSEIFVRPFPMVDGGKWMVSVNGGTQPRWARSGRELFYVTYPRIFGVLTTPGAAFTYEKPKLVLDNMEYSFGPYSFGTTTAYDVSDDGRFVVMRAEGVGNENSRSLVVITNWFEELRAKLAAVK